MVDNSHEIYKFIDIPVIIISEDFKIKFMNEQFILIFGSVTSLKKFIHNFNFEVCILANNDIAEYNPISEALKSDCCYTAQITYQDSKNNFLPFELNSLKNKKQNETVLFFNSSFTEEELQKTKKELADLKIKYNQSIEKNKQVAKLEQAAREHSVNMALINKISHQIRHSIDSDVIIQTTLKELLAIIGGFKGYWATPFEDDFIINLIYPKNSLPAQNTRIIFDNTTKKIIYSKKIDIATCLKEYMNASSGYKKGVHRILIPVSSPTTFFGVIVLLTRQKESLNSVENILYALSTQLATEIMQATLFKQLNDKNAALEKTLLELKETQLQLINSEKMASLGHLIAGIAHEINTPIGSINANNAIINKLIKKFAPQAQKTHNTYLNILTDINKIDKEAIERISKIVTSLKKFVRLDESDLQEADINNELDITLNLIRHETKNKIEIIKEYGELPPIKCYPNMLNQVFMNILVNACQSIENKGSIFITTGFINGNLSISIRDTGCGMSEEVKKNIFTPGFTTKGVGVGTGIGLAITYKIIEKHKGKIEVKSVPNKGSEFIITIPSTDN